MARRLRATVDGLEFECEFHPTWFKDMCGQGGLADMMRSEAAAIADRADGLTPNVEGLDNPNFNSGVDDDRGWPHGRVWAANPYSARYEAKHKVLSRSL